MSCRGLIEGILLAVLAITILALRHRIVDYIIRRIEMKRRNTLVLRAMDLKRKYRTARAEENWTEANRLQREYLRTKNAIRAMDRAAGIEKAPGDVAASTEDRSNKTQSVYHSSGEDASHD